MDSLYRYPSFYDLLHFGRGSDLPFYLDATEGCARVLEYGVGSGRIAIPLARRGQQVVGVDPSEPMLAALHARLDDEPDAVRDRVQTICGDARELELDERFDVITCPFNGIAHHLELEELGAFLGRVRQHLRSGGRFVFDVAIPSPALLAGTSSDIPWFRDPVEGFVCRATEQIEYDSIAQVLTITTTKRAMEGEHEPVQMVLRLRQLFPAETLLLLLHHGFEVMQRNTELGDVIGYVCRPG